MRKNFTRPLMDFGTLYQFRCSKIILPNFQDVSKFMIPSLPGDLDFLAQIMEIVFYYQFYFIIFCGIWPMFVTKLQIAEQQGMLIIYSNE